MRITYDSEVDALYIRFLDTTVSNQFAVRDVLREVALETSALQ